MINHIIYFFSPRVKKNAEIIAMHNISAAVLKGPSTKNGQGSRSLFFPLCLWTVWQLFF